ncbi:MAG: hypothetical protein HYZ42_03275 [Bacteroidetes bacterium]|nr:hypothetical protein [Bacteroidota bacterium]
MKKITAREIAFEKFKPLFLYRGYKITKKGLHGFKLEDERGYIWFFFDFNSYGETQYLYYEFYMKINCIQDIFNKVKVKYNETIDEYTRTIQSSYQFRPYNEQIKLGLKIQAKTEEVHIQNLDYVCGLLAGVEGFIEQFESYFDIRNIDKVVGGDNFWKNDEKTPFSFVDSYLHKQIVVAHLCRNPRLPEILEFRKQRNINFFRENPNYNREAGLIDGKDSVDYLLELLKDIEPIY